VIVAIFEVRICGELFMVDRSLCLSLPRGEKSQERSMAIDPKTTMDGASSLLVDDSFCLVIRVEDGVRGTNLSPLNEHSSAPLYLS
jgi:hypothetical protein